jgi:apolipoprotein N-acyltransferase
MKLTKRHNAWLLATAFLCSSLLHILAFPPFELPELAFLCLAPAALGLLFIEADGRTIRRAALVSGFLTWGGLLVWLRHIGDFVGLGWPGGWAALLLLSGLLGLFWAGWWVLAGRFLPRAETLGGVGRVLLMGALAGAWVVLEWVRGWVFTGFPWLPLAASQWERPALLQIAAWTGAWGVSFVLVFFNLGVAFYIKHLTRTRQQKGWLAKLSPEFYAAMGVLFGSLLVMPGAGLGGATESRHKLRVAPVQPDIPQNLKWDSGEARQNRELLERHTRFAALLEPDLILWPEAATPTPVVGDPAMREWVEKLSRELEVPILMGSVAVYDGEGNEARRETYDHAVNATFIADPETGLDPARFYAKRKLVPLGEYIPLRGFFFFLGQLAAFDDLRAGTEATVLPLFIDFRSYRAGSLICYEDIFAHLARENVLAGADFHFVATNNAWYGTEGMAYQHAAHSVLRAVETRRPVLRVGNNGWSGWIDPTGIIRYVLEDTSGSVYFGGTDVMEVAIDSAFRGQQSFYVKHGDWFVGLAAALSGLLWFLRPPPVAPGKKDPENSAEEGISEARRKARTLLQRRKIG